MTVSPVTSSQDTQGTAPVAQPAQQAQAAPAKPQAAASTPTDTVTISAQAKAALQEATENATQTAQEALKGDRQAIRLQAKEEAAAAESGERQPG